MEPIDIIIAGSGIACTTTVIALFRKLIHSPAQQTISISIIEKHHEFWTGIPYGNRSSVNALTITSIADFFTDEKERELFFEWFKLNQQELLTGYLVNGGLTAGEWLQRNKIAIDNEDWKSVYLPRFMFGRYLNEILKGLLKIVEDRKLVKLTLINAEVINAAPVNDQYEITLEYQDKTQSKLVVRKLVIATGSAPVINITVDDNVTLINNLYEPTVNDNITKLKTALTNITNTTDRNVLIVGSNASSIEFLYLLAGLPHITGLINKLVVVSKSGLLPYHILDKELAHYPTESLDQLKENGGYDIKTLVAAAMQDINAAVKDGVIIPHIDRIISYTFELMAPLGEEARKKFIGIYGMQLSNLFRRSGADYKGGEAVLHQTQKLTLLKGAFVNVESGFLNYTDPPTGEQNKYDTPFKVVINCTGANDLDKSSSRLIYSLVHNGIAKVNLSGKGFYVNENFEAAPNLYIMGPLLGGNMNSRIHFWHLENASRLIYLAPFLAGCLLQDFF